MPKSCRFGGATKSNGNCSIPGDDGLPVQCVGAWSREKHGILERYIAATRATRAKYLPPNPGGAAFVDLFAGPGRARVRGTRELIDGGPLIALKHTEAPFTKVILCDADPENAGTLRRRTAPDGRVRIEEGDSNQLIDDLAAEVPTHGLNLALIDPFNLAGLWFSTIAKLAVFKRMDLIVFFPVWQIRRFAEAHRVKYGPWLTRALGTDEWQKVLRRAADVPRALTPLFHRQLEKRFGYTPENTYSVPVRGAKGVALYHLVVASKHARGDRIWESVTRRTGGQTRLF